MFVVEEAAGEAFPGHAPSGTPAGSGPQSQIIAVVRLSHEASLHKRSASPLCRLGSAIPGSAQSRKGLPGHSLRTVEYSPRLGLCDFQEKPSRPVPCT